MSFLLAAVMFTLWILIQLWTWKKGIFLLETWCVCAFCIGMDRRSHINGNQPQSYKVFACFSPCTVSWQNSKLIYSEKVYKRWGLSVMHYLHWNISWSFKLTLVNALVLPFTSTKLKKKIKLRLYEYIRTINQGIPGSTNQRQLIDKAIACILMS